MTTGAIIDLIRELESAGVRYLVAGGFAVIAHGYPRGTEDIDLVIALDEGNSRRVIELLASLGYRPRVPVDPLDFVDPAKRESWMRDRRMLAFTMVRPRPESPDVDIFLSAPFDFEEEWERSARYALGPEVSVPVVSLETLLRMKDEAGRDKDVLDAVMLRRIRGARG